MPVDFLNAHARVQIESDGCVSGRNALSGPHALLGSHAILSFSIMSGEWGEHADAPHALALLRPRRERPRGRRAAEQRDEVAPFYLIEWHSIPHQPGPNTRISNWPGSVRGYSGRFARNIVPTRGWLVLAEQMEWIDRQKSTPR